MKNEITIFLSGQVSGLKREEAVSEFRAGRKATEKLLRESTIPSLGEVPNETNLRFINPMDIVPESASNAEAMGLLLPMLTRADLVSFLPNHRFSEGSRVEMNLALYLHKPVIFLK